MIHLGRPVDRVEQKVHILSEQAKRYDKYAEYNSGKRIIN